MKIINNELIRSFSPCYDPREKGIPDNESLRILGWIKKYRIAVPAKDILWLLLRQEFFSDKDLRLFAVWCAREALKLVKNPDIRIIEACNVVERFANGEATKEELYSARAAIWAAAKAATGAAEWAAAWVAAKAASWAAALDAGVAARVAANEASLVAAMDAGVARDKQLEYLIENYITK